MSKRLLNAAALIAVAFNCPASWAQVQVIDAVPRAAGSSLSSAGTGLAVSSPSGEANNVQTQMYNQLQALRQEVQELRGLVEEQGFELKNLKQQRLDDYMNIDRRLSSMGKGGASAPSPTGSNSSAASSNVSASNAGTPAAAGDELEEYRSAIQLVLKDKNYDAAITQFNHYLKSYPQGRYEPNVQYWLGEIYLLQGDFEQSRKWFSTLLDTYPQHDKSPDAKYKLGTVYHKLGNVAKARSLLNEVAASDSNAARLARDYLASELP